MPGAIAIRADCMRPENVWKLIDVQEAKESSQDYDEVNGAVWSPSAR